MHTTSFLLSTLALGAIRFAHANEGIESDDVPSQCLDRCRSVIDVSSSCDDQSFSSNDRELQCICTGQDMATAIPDCEACIRPFWQGSDDDDYDETNNLLTRCNLTAASETTSTPTTGGSTKSSSSSSGSTSMTITSSASMPSTTQTTLVSVDSSGTSTVVLTSTIGGGAGGAFATPVAGVGFAAVMAGMMAL